MDKSNVLIFHKLMLIAKKFELVKLKSEKIF